jgi:hypothetical protein
MVFCVVKKNIGTAFECYLFTFMYYSTCSLIYILWQYITNGCTAKIFMYNEVSREVENVGNPRPVA